MNPLGWQLLLGLAVAGGLLIAINAAVELGERRGLISTYRGPDDFVRYADEPVFGQTADGQWLTTTPYGRKTMVPSRFRRQKRENGWRMFVLGGSFAMGSPYTHQLHDTERSGGIASWLRDQLAADYPESEIEVLNAATGAQNSSRVRRIADQVVNFDPDVLLVLTCNNEGALPPGVVTEQLRRFGGFRLMMRLMAPLEDGLERSHYTAQDAPTAALREVFRENIRAILAAAEARGVPILLGTLPVNLRYTGEEVVHTLSDEGAFRGVAALEVIEPPPGEAARRKLEEFEEHGPLEALRRLGLELYRQGDYEHARHVLEQHTELAPYNRCRPSFNEIIREEAVRAANAALVDLEERARALSPHGVPGGELFLDYCHMNREGYAAMAEAILEALREYDLGP